MGWCPAPRSPSWVSAARFARADRRLDLDLVLITISHESNDNYRPPPTRRWRSISTRLTQRLVAALTVPTRRGLLYEVDLRGAARRGKEPSHRSFGASGQTRTTRPSCGSTWRSTATRVIAGDEAFRDSARQEAISAHPRHAARRVDRFRSTGGGDARIDRAGKGEHDPWDLKLARGGLTDLILSRKSPQARLSGKIMPGSAHRLRR